MKFSISDLKKKNYRIPSVITNQTSGWMDLANDCGGLYYNSQKILFYWISENPLV